MPIPERATTPERTALRMRVSIFAACAVLLTLAGTYAAAGELSTAAGVLCGGAFALTVVWIAIRRAARRGAEAATATRVFGGRGDERDKQVYLMAMSAVALVAFAVSALLPVAVQLGLSADTALAVTPYVLIVTGVIAFVVVDRRS